MPRLIACDDDRAIGFAEFLDELDASPFDPRDEDSFAALAPQLKRLANNLDFLADYAMAELENRFAEQQRINDYGFQVLLLHRAANYFIRANFWPARNDPLTRRSGTAPFFYDVPHDHNFSFLTVGYFGPGYWSDYYEYDYRRVAGYPGEKVDLQFIERSRLEQGKMLLYRAHRDIHRQLPADSLSVSLNIVEVSAHSGWLDQYRFDIERGEIAEIMTLLPGTVLLRLAAQLGGEAGRGLAADFARQHPSDHIRYGAISAQAAAAAEREERIAILEHGCGDPSVQVREMCRARLALCEAMPGSTG